MHYCTIYVLRQTVRTVLSVKTCSSGTKLGITECGVQRTTCHAIFVCKCDLCICEASSALNEFFCILNCHCLRGSEFPTLFVGHGLGLFFNRWCNFPSWPLFCNWMLVIFMFSVIMGDGGGVGIVFPSWSHVTSSLTGNLVFREEQAVNRYVSLSQFFLYHAAATCILFIICIGYIVWNTWYWCRFIDITQNTKSLVDLETMCWKIVTIILLPPKTHLHFIILEAGELRVRLVFIHRIGWAYSLNCMHKMQGLESWRSNIEFKDNHQKQGLILLMSTQMPARLFVANDVVYFMSSSVWRGT